jgi:hypothetical protein
MTPWKQEKHRLNLSMSNRGLQMGFVILNDFDTVYVLICSDAISCPPGKHWFEWFEDV